MTSDGEQSSPIHQVVWVLKNIYGTELEPPSSVAAIEPDIRGAKTVKKFYRLTNSNPVATDVIPKLTP